MHIKDWYGSDWEDINGIAIKPLFLQCFFGYNIIIIIILLRQKWFLCQMILLK